MRKRLANLVAIGIIAGGLVSVATAVVTPQPAAAFICIGEDCGPSSISIEFKDGPYRYGKPFQVQAKVRDEHPDCDTLPAMCYVPSGTVEFYEDGVGPPIATGELHNACDGHLNCRIGTTGWKTVCCIRAGTPAILYKYVPGGDYPFGRTAGQTEINVAQAPTQTVLTVSPYPSVYGEPVTLKARVTPTVPISNRAHPIQMYVNFKSEDAQGNARLIAGAFVDSSGVATLVTDDLDLGSSRIRAEYETDGDYATSNDSVFHSVDRGVVTNTLSQSSATSVYGEPFSLTSTVAPVAPSTGAPSGEVTFKAGVAPLGTAPLNGASPGVATLSTTAAGVGTHSIVADYPGDAGYNAKTSNTLNHTVTKAGTGTTLAATTPNPSNVGDPVTLSASVAVVAPGAGTPTGSVQFFDGAATLGAPVALSGVTATLGVRGLGGGAHSLTARYLGDGNFNSSTSTPQTHAVRCDVVVSNVNGNYTAPASGTTCIVNGNISGSVTVPAGASLSVVNSTIGGTLMSTSAARSIVICGSSLGDVTINNTSGALTVGSPYIDGCAGNAFRSNVRLQSNRGGVRFDGNQVAGGVQVTGTSGGATVIGGNTVAGWLQCSGNSPAATNGGKPNSAAGRTGECGASGF